MDIGLDTSMVIRLLTGKPEPLASRALEDVLAVQHGGGACEICDLVVCESYFALTYHYGLTKADALDALKRMSDFAGFRFSECAKKLLHQADIARLNPGFEDRLIHGTYAARGLPLHSCERAATRLPNAIVIAE